MFFVREANLTEMVDGEEIELLPHLHDTGVPFREARGQGEGRRDDDAKEVRRLFRCSFRVRIDAPSFGRLHAEEEGAEAVLYARRIRGDMLGQSRGTAGGGGGKEGREHMGGREGDEPRGREGPRGGGREAKESNGRWRGSLGWRGSAAAREVQQQGVKRWEGLPSLLLQTEGKSDERWQ